MLAGAGIVGDNNGNGVLDTGDATLLLRLLIQLDTMRPWDTARNDLNLNLLVDSGDAIRILMAAAEVHTPPTLKALLPQEEPVINSELGMLSPAFSRGSNGLVTYQVKLQNVRGPISGAAFTLNYPPGVLRISNPQARLVGSIVPGGSVVVWNMTPTNNYAEQNGHVRFVVSSGSVWPTNNGVLAQVTFQIEASSTNQYAWPITLSSMEVNSLGYSRSIMSDGALFISRDPRPALLHSLTRLTNGIFQFGLAGDAQAIFQIDASSDLVNWTTVTNVANTTGTLLFSDPTAVGLPRQFYRARPLNP